MAELAIAEGGQSVPRHGVSLREAFRVWLRVAMLSFGGPAGQIAVMHRILVEEKRWISESRFLHALNYCMLLPGPEAQQLATYIGWLMHRTLGGIMAGVLFVVPGIIAIMALSYVYAGYGNVPAIAALFFGLKAAVLAIVLEAVVRIGKRSLKNNVMRALAAAAFVGIFFFNIPFPIIIFGAALIGFVGASTGAAAFQLKGGHGDWQARCRRGRQPPRRGAARTCAADRCASVAGVERMARPLAHSGHRASAHAWAGGTSSARSPSSSARWRWSPSAAPMRCSPMSPSRRSRTTAGSSPARCSMAWEWRRRRRGR